MKENNEMIAEFYGLPKVGDMWEAPSAFELSYFLKFHTSWDWLMPVVEKIEKEDRTLINIYREATKIWVDDPDGIELFATTEYDNNSKISHVYKAVVEFINWCNTTTQQQPKQEPSKSIESSKEL